ncbi:S8 family peptidase [Streptomyces sp. MS2.AVA.5]|uniref:S8 family serine peptidase n=1 Tax=Streptomyces achmelvichensis TaxID=3134111 RepID=A0ACC6PNL3_9ACTN
MRWIRRSAAISTVLMVTVGGVTTASAGTPPDGPSPIADREASATVRLITGDRVIVTTVPGGRHVASVRPGPGRERISFRTEEGDDKALTVIPSNAQSLVTAGTLDRRLFDVTALIAAGLDEKHSSSLPLIVSSESSPAAAKDARRTRATAVAADRLMTFRATRTPVYDLDSINARSMRVAAGELGRFWDTLASAAGSNAARAAVTPRISLDGKVRAVLDRSTGQINAPAAWKAGYHGKGVKVAVLDTGVDDTHPDLSGRIAQAKDFSNSGSTGDRFGHGTHVAATVGGTGAASGGSMRGVAAEAELLVGKVLDDNGYGTESSVIEGMEWAAAQDAKVINMSLGGGPTDGTDPMSQAVNALTASTDSLFVIAAGNDGANGQSTIGSPGTANAALTVGAVDRDDSLAGFSSRGPRLGDGAVKPDVTAPGVGIVAARAAGTTMGTPVNANYVAASGTSMATPHVAGAAAILAQQHPNWSAQQLKDALISTSKTVSGTKVTQQGGGRIDLATAVGPLTASGSLAFAPVRAGERKGQTQTLGVRYANTGSRPLTLDLGVSLATDGGQVPAAGAVRLGSTSLTLAPGAETEVPLHLDAAGVNRGKYYGYVTAKSSDGVVQAHTTVSLQVSGRQHVLTVVPRDRQGRPSGSNGLPNIWGPTGYVSYTDLEKGVAVVEEGTYLLQGGFFSENENGGEAGELIVPEVKVTKDTTVAFDASDVTEVTIRTPRPAEQRGFLSTQYYREVEGERRSWGLQMFDSVKRVYVSRTAPVTEGAFEFSSRWQLTAPQLEARVPGMSRPLVPYYEQDSPVFGDRGARLSAVSAGTGTAPDFRHVRGKLAVVRVDPSDDTWALARAAKSAGARALMVSWPEGILHWTRWRPGTERMAVPTMRVSFAQGSELLERAKKGAAVAFSGTVHSPYLYDVMQVSKGHVPDKLVHTVSERESAVIRSAYTQTGASSWTSEQRFGWRPYQNTAWDVSNRYTPVGRERVEYVSGGDTLWDQVVHHNVIDSPDRPLTAGMMNLPRTYRPGEKVSERWFGAPARPSIPRGAGRASVRTGDTLSVFIPEFTDSTAGHYGFAEAPAFPGGGVGGGRAANDLADTSHAVLYRNGQLIEESDNGAWGDIEVPAGDAEYRLDLTTARTSDDWRFGTGTRTSWTFRSGTAAGPTRLPLLQVDYSVATDLFNAVAPGRTHALGINVRMQDGMQAPRGTSVKVETSYDGGRTWTTATTARKGDGFTATVKRPDRVHTDAYVTVRVTAKDAAGNSVRQTVDRAYLHPAAR